MKGLLSVAVCVAAVGCGDEATGPATVPTVPSAEAAPVVAQYAAGVLQSYTLSVQTATAMQTAIGAFLAAPSEGTMAAAKTAWITAREPYGQTEAFRFYGGPIDDEATGNIEGRINAWPMDENYVDYVVGAPMSGMINDRTGTPMISRDVLIMANERGGEENIATGWHAVEFLLWGQDMNANGPGARPFTDYLTTGGTAANQDRRREYLQLVTQLLVSDLTTVRDAWQPTAANSYATSFTADTTVALRRMLTGMGSLSGAELAGERMTVAYEERDQEDEHSCFSDNTHNDLINNAISIQNVYLGRYGTNDGPGIDDLVQARDPALNTRMKQQLQTSVDLLRAIPAPFDQAILGDDTAPGRVAIARGIAALRAQRNTIVEVAARLGIALNIE